MSESEKIKQMDNDLLYHKSIKIAWNWLASFDLEDIKIGGRPNEKIFSPGSLEGKS